MRILILILCLLFAFNLKSQTIVDISVLPNWDNAVTKYGAVGNGITDNTAAFNFAIQNGRNPVYATAAYKRLNNSSVLYLPAGTYNINSTVIMKGRIGLSIIGENPKNTFINWTGGNNDTALLIANSAYCKISRITFLKNSNQTGVSALASKYLKYGIETDSARSWSPTSNEYSDLKFVGFAIGLDIGTFNNERPDNPDGPGTGTMDSEYALYRNQFFECKVGISIKGFNALDHWIWDSYFNNCDTSIKNNSGNFHVYNSFFNRSKIDMISLSAGYYISVRNCISTNSGRLFSDPFFSTNPHKRIFQGNSVYNTKYEPIYYLHTGGFEFFDNKFYNLKNPLNPTANVAVIGGLWGYFQRPYGNYNVLSINNIYPKQDPLFIDRPIKTIYSLRDVVDSGLKEVPIFQGIIYRRVIPNLITIPKREVDSYVTSGNALADSLQNIINTLDYAGNKKYTIYFPSGYYFLNHKIVIPSNANLDIKGDGFFFGTTITTTFGYGTYNDSCFFQVNYPAKCNFYDIGLSEIGNGSGVSNAYMQGIKYVVPNNGTSIRIQNDQQYGSGSLTDTSLLIKIGATKVTYLKTSSFFSDNGSLSNIKKYYSFGGQYAGSRVNKSNLVTMDCWWEGNLATNTLSGNGNIVISSGMNYASPTISRQQTMDFKNLTGNLYLTNFRYRGRFGDSTFNYSNLNVLSYNVDHIQEFNPRATFALNRFKNASMFGTTYDTDNTENPNNVIGLQPAIDYTNNRVVKNSMILDYYFYMVNALNELKAGIISNSNSYYKTSRISFDKLKYHFVITN